MRMAFEYKGVQLQVRTTDQPLETRGFYHRVFGMVCREEREGVQIIYPCCGEPNHNELQYRAGDWPLFERTVSALQERGPIVAIGQYFASYDNENLRHFGLAEVEGSYSTIAYAVSPAGYYLPRTQGAGGFYGAKLVCIEPEDFEAEFGVKLPVSVPPESKSPLHMLVNMREPGVEYIPARAKAFCCCLGAENRFNVCLGGERELTQEIWYQVSSQHQDLGWWEVNTDLSALLAFDYHDGIPADVIAKLRVLER